MGFFGTYGFLNVITYFLTKQFYFRKYKKTILIICVFGVFASLSFKAIGAFLFLLFILNKNKLKLFFIAFSISVMGIVIFPKRTYDLAESLTYRIQTYITEGNSARSESYRVMFEDITDFKFIGRGVGSFGGASSTRYDSPVYNEVKFNWYDTKHLATTDTYFPHVFVELGIIGGMIYILTIMIPLFKRRYLKSVLLFVFVVYFALFFDSLFSFAMNNLGYLMVSLILVYPILEYQKNIKQLRT
ncbi:MAG: O-antigen ligase family protein [Nonlabens sp.]